MTTIMDFNPATIKRQWIQKKMGETTMRVNLEREYDELNLNREIFLKAVGIANDHFKRENKVNKFNVFNDDYGFLGKRITKTVEAKNFAWLIKELGLTKPGRFSYSQQDEEIQISYWNDNAQKMEHFRITPIREMELLANF